MSRIAIGCLAVCIVLAAAAETMTPYPEGKKAAIAFTFDDATLDQYEDALPILGKHGVKAIFNVIPARVGGDQELLDYRAKYEAWKKRERGLFLSARK